MSDKAHSVAQRLLNFSKQQNEEYTFVLARYGAERLLYRLSLSPLGKRFMLKGASLFLVWFGHAFRTTRDIDLLGEGASDLDSVANLFRELCRPDMLHLDGLVFDADSVVSQRILAAQDYEGVRVKLRATLGRSRIDLQVDIGFGDPVTPGPDTITFPVLLDAPAPILLAYPYYTAMAEKFNAMVSRDLANSRMKDFYDLILMFRSFNPKAEILATAIDKTFANRGTEIPRTVPLALTEGFSGDDQKRVQWNAFKKKSRLTQPMGDLSEVVLELREQFVPALQCLGVVV